ncbi:MAG: class B sortase [Clostridiales bacterium]|nr:class B sortase [Clostridiales bacterium]
MSAKLRIILTFALALILILSAAKVVITEIEYKKAAAAYDKSREENFFLSTTVSSCISGEYFPNVYVDLYSLKSVNPETIGWLWIPGTNISYPLMQSDDNFKYLNRTYSLQKSSSGAIFIDYRNSPDFSDALSVIYGHNMKSGDMFGGLKKYSDPLYLSEHSDMYIFTEKSSLKYKIFTAFIVGCDSPLFSFGFSERTGLGDLPEYIKSCAGGSILNEPDGKSPVVMLSTCTSAGRDKRFVVLASLEAEKESQSAF